MQDFSAKFLKGRLLILKMRKKQRGKPNFYATIGLKKDLLYGIIFSCDCDENPEEGRVWFKSPAIGNVR